MIVFLEKLLSSLDPKNSTECFMKIKFLPGSGITFSWLKYEEIMKTFESQVGWLLQKMALEVSLIFNS